MALKDENGFVAHLFKVRRWVLCWFSESTVGKSLRCWFEYSCGSFGEGDGGIYRDGVRKLSKCDFMVIARNSSDCSLFYARQCPVSAPQLNNNNICQPVVGLVCRINKVRLTDSFPVPSMLQHSATQSSISLYVTLENHLSTTAMAFRMSLYFTSWGVDSKISMAQGAMVEGDDRFDCSENLTLSKSY